MEVSGQVHMLVVLLPKRPHLQLDRRIFEPQSWMDMMNRYISDPASNQPRLPGHPFYSLVTVQDKLSHWEFTFLVQRV